MKIQSGKSPECGQPGPVPVFEEIAFKTKVAYESSQEAETHKNMQTRSNKHCYNGL